MRYPTKDAPRGKKESEEHYFRRLREYRASKQKQSFTNVAVESVKHVPWKEFITLSFKPGSVLTAEQQMSIFTTFIEDIRVRTFRRPRTFSIRRPRIFAVAETFPHPHLHVLTEIPLRHPIHFTWNYGEAHIEPYQGIGALYYIFSKYRTSEINYFGDIDFFGDCPNYLKQTQ